jgi:hypothetical protein
MLIGNLSLAINAVITWSSWPNEVEKTTLSLNSLAKKESVSSIEKYFVFSLTICAIAELILLLFIKKSITL